MPPSSRRPATSPDSERDPALWLIRLVEPATALATAGYGTREHAESLRRVDDRSGGSSIVSRCCVAARRHGDLRRRGRRLSPGPYRIAPNMALVRESLIGRDPRSTSGVRSWLALARSNGRSAYVYARDAENAVAARGSSRPRPSAAGLSTSSRPQSSPRAGADPQAWFGLGARPGHRASAMPWSVRSCVRPSCAAARAGCVRGEDVRSSETGGAVGFVAWGRGVREQVRMPKLALVDVGADDRASARSAARRRLDGRTMVGILRASRAAAAARAEAPRTRLGATRGPARSGARSDAGSDRGAREPAITIELNPRERRLYDRLRAAARRSRGRVRRRGGSGPAAPAARSHDPARCG